MKAGWQLILELNAHIAAEAARQSR
jgi:hypothetical protein